MIIVESKTVTRYYNLPICFEIDSKDFYVRILNGEGHCMWDGWIENEWDSIDTLNTKIKKALKGEIDLYLTEIPKNED